MKSPFEEHVKGWVDKEKKKGLYFPGEHVLHLNEEISHEASHSRRLQLLFMYIVSLICMAVYKDQNSTGPYCCLAADSICTTAGLERWERGLEVAVEHWNAFSGASGAPYKQWRVVNSHIKGGC